MQTTTATKFEIAPCHKCGGQGTIDCYAHIEGGVCFRCGGTGYDAAKYAEIVGQQISDFANAKAARAALAEIEDAAIAADIAAVNAVVGPYDGGDYVTYLLAWGDALNERNERAA